MNRTNLLRELDRISKLNWYSQFFLFKPNILTLIDAIKKFLMVENAFYLKEPSEQCNCPSMWIPESESLETVLSFTNFVLNAFFWVCLYLCSQEPKSSSIQELGRINNLYSALFFFWVCVDLICSLLYFQGWYV